jgi:hypothetical protein
VPSRTSSSGVAAANQAVQNVDEFFHVGDVQAQQCK